MVASIDDKSEAKALPHQGASALYCSNTDSLHLVCRASELKEELNRLGLPSTGSRQQLEERLMHHYETAQDAQYEALAAQVALLSMSDTV